MKMRPLEEFPAADRANIKYVLMDIDDTLTLDGRLPAAAYSALERLKESGFATVPITGRPAGWCDHIARMWPVNGVVGENGALYFCYDDAKKKMVRRYWKSNEERAEDRKKLDIIRDEILKEVVGAAVASDQAYREADLAIDFCEDVPPLPRSAVDEIVGIFVRSGATAKISSIHVNGWFGQYDKLSMTRIMFREIFSVDLDEIKEQVVFAGDSPNDEPMFGFFPNSAGVANVADFEGLIKREPAWVASKRGGYGFAQIADVLLAAR